MGILSLVNRNLVSNSKSQLKYLSSSSNLWFIRRISNSNTGLSKAHESHAPTGDLKSNNKLILLIKYFHKDSWVSSNRSFPYSYSEISTKNSWTDHYNFFVDFSEFGNSTFAGSCNELMLVFFYKVDAPFDEGYGKYLLWNRTTHKSTVLPPPGPTSNYAHGFGFDSESEDYKLIRLPLFTIESKVKLFSLKTNSWKEIAYPEGCGNLLQKPCVQVNGVYYWETIIRRSSANILSFDFASEKFSAITPRPPKFDVHSKGWMGGLYVDDFVIVEFDGSLAAVVHSGNMVKPFSFEVWGWNGESWLEKVPRTTIDVPGGVLGVLGLFQDDKLFLQGWRKGEVLLFDLEKSKLEFLGIHADPLKVKIFPVYAGSSI